MQVQQQCGAKVKQKYKTAMSATDGFLNAAPRGDIVLQAACSELKAYREEIQQMVKGFAQDYIILSPAALKKKYPNDDQQAELINSFVTDFGAKLRLLEAANLKFQSHLAVIAPSL